MATVKVNGVDEVVGNMTDKRVRELLSQRRGLITRLTNPSNNTGNAVNSNLQRYRDEESSLQQAYQDRGLANSTPSSSTASATVTPTAASTASTITPAVVTNLKEARAAVTNARTVKQNAETARDEAQQTFDAHDQLLKTQEDIDVKTSAITAELNDLKTLEEIKKRSGFFRRWLLNGKAVNQADKAEFARLQPGVKFSKANAKNAIKTRNNNIANKRSALSALQSTKTSQIAALATLGFTDPLDTKDQIKAARDNANNELNEAKTYANDAADEVTRLEGLETQFENSRGLRNGLLMAGGLGLAAATALVTFVPASAGLTALALGAGAVGFVVAAPTVLGSSFSSGIRNFIAEREWIANPVQLSVAAATGGLALFTMTDPAVANNLADIGQASGLSNLMPDIGWGPAAPYIEAAREWTADALSAIKSLFVDASQAEQTAAPDLASVAPDSGTAPTPDALPTTPVTIEPVVTQTAPDVVTAATPEASPVVPSETGLVQTATAEQALIDAEIAERSWAEVDERNNIEDYYYEVINDETIPLEDRLDEVKVLISGIDLERQPYLEGLVLDLEEKTSFLKEIADQQTVEQVTPAVVETAPQTVTDIYDPSGIVDGDNVAGHNDSAVISEWIQEAEAAGVDPALIQSLDAKFDVPYDFAMTADSITAINAYCEPLAEAFNDGQITPAEYKTALTEGLTALSNAELVTDIDGINHLDDTKAFTQAELDSAQQCMSSFGNASSAAQPASATSELTTSIRPAARPIPNVS